MVAAEAPGRQTPVQCSAVQANAPHGCEGVRPQGRPPGLLRCFLPLIGGWLEVPARNH